MSDILWSSVYIPLSGKKKIVLALRDLLAAAGYRPYNPFPGGSGTPTGITHTVRLFVAPSLNNWTRVLGSLDNDLLEMFSTHLQTPLLSVWVSAEEGRIEVFGGEISDFYREGITDTHYEAAQLHPPEADASGDALTDFARAQGVDSQQAEALIDKTTRNMMKAMNRRGGGETGDMGEQAAALIAGNTGFSWNSLPARQVRGQVALLTLPDHWQHPSFTDLAAAFPIALMLENDENAPLLPGDEALLDRVEYPLDYTPVYFAR